MKSKTSILMTIKTLIILLISVSLFSCGKNLPTNKAMKTPYLVESIETFDKEGYCVYNLTTGVDNINFRDNISVVDSIGKFSINDSVYLSLNKK